MHGIHLDTGIGEEAVDDQDDTGDTRPRRQEMVRVHRGSRVVSLQQVGDAESDEDCPRDQGPDQRPTRGELCHESNSPRGDEHATPEQNDDDDGVVDAIGGQARIDDVGERPGDVGEQGGVIEDRLGKLAPDGQEPHRGRHTFSHPVVDATLPAGRQLRGDQGDGHQEHECREDVQEHRGETEDRRGRCGPEIADGSHRHHRQHRPGDVPPRGGLGRPEGHAGRPVVGDGSLGNRWPRLTASSYPHGLRTHLFSSTYRHVTRRERRRPIRLHVHGTATRAVPAPDQ